MNRAVRIRVFSGEQRDRAARGYRWVVSQPGWITRVALLSFLVVVGLPVLLLLVLAVAASVLVFGGLALLNAGAVRLRGMLPRRGGRRNVRVVGRQERG